MSDTATPKKRQSGRSQLVDALVILALLFVTLFATTWIVEKTTPTASTASTKGKTVDQLPLTGAERQQYKRMVSHGMVDQKTAAQQVAQNKPNDNQYPINPWLLLGTAVLLAGYLAFVYRTSFKEYREVIELKFGRRTE
ncbi:MAG: hypothetical protein J2P24_07955 [Streptosporangiales bacterium]|nr:hypothetical protein [Streptosporangiales bacterium]MBO0890476.1 hypothetical protein [Acidothermales bacterium]